MRPRSAPRWRSLSFIVAAVCAAATLTAAAPAAADHATRPHTPNLKALGHSPFPATFLGQPDGVRKPSSDLAFRGNLIFQGNYDGFRIIRRSTLEVISHPSCNGDQGDLVVWKNIVVSWNSKKERLHHLNPQTQEFSFSRGHGHGHR